MDVFARSPNRIPWPPLIFIGAILAAAGLEAVDDRGWPEGALATLLAVFGILLFLVGAALVGWVVYTFRQHKANILPNRAATTLITRGPFAFSRNPNYLGIVLMLLGAALFFGSVYVLASAFIAAVLVHNLAILREEKHLAAKFGGEYEVYRFKTPRWFGRR